MKLKISIVQVFFFSPILIGLPASGQTIRANIETTEALEFQRNLLALLFILSVMVLVTLAIGFFRKRRIENSLFQMQEDLSEKNTKLKASLAEKDALLKEIHHRVKNNMQLVSSIFLLQTKEIKDPAALLAINQSQSRIKAMGLVHQKVYQAEDVAKVDFQEFIPDLVAQIKPLYEAGETISAQINAQGIHLGLDIAVPLGLIIHELVSNAFKFAFQQGDAGTVYIELKRSNGQFELIVKDTGTGMPVGFDFTRATTLGLKLVRMLTEQLNGEMSFSTDPGTEISVIFKAP